MAKTRCACGGSAIGVVIMNGKPVPVCQTCYRAACLEAAHWPSGS
jgi:hypothetical protein